MKLRSIVVDDEYNCRNNLKLMLDDFCPEIDVIGMADSADKARELISAHEPTVVFLDVKMPKEDGFTFLRSMKDRNFSVVFTTAHNEFALKAFKANAIDYIEKPINIDELRNAVEKLSRYHTDGTDNGSFADNVALQQLIEGAIHSKETDKITIPTKDGFIMVKSSEIIHMEASDNYTMIYLVGNQRYLSCKNIKVYEESLSQKMFFRTHKSHIINIMYHLKEFTRSEGNIAIMSNDQHVPISRRKLSEFLNRINTI
jgi:two-component system LytT family response regulator